MTDKTDPVAQELAVEVFERFNKDEIAWDRVPPYDRVLWLDMAIAALDSSAFHAAVQAEVKRQVGAVRKLLVRRDGCQYEHDGHGIGDGHDACPGCWVEDLRAALAGPDGKGKQCSTCDGTGRVDWAPGQIRDLDDDQQPCPDCDGEPTDE